MKKKYILIAFAFILTNFLVSCSSTDNLNSNVENKITSIEKQSINEKKQTQDAQIDKDDEECKKVIRNYFESISNHNIEQYNSTLVTMANGLQNDSYFYKYFDVKVSSISKEEEKTAKNIETSFRENGRGKNLKPNKVLIFSAEYSMKLKNSDNQIEEIKRNDYFYMVKVKPDSPWQIADIGV